jgi:hypothetical protein
MTMRRPFGTEAVEVDLDVLRDGHDVPRARHRSGVGGAAVWRV